MTKYVKIVKSLKKPIRSSLSSLTIELTERCNNNCVHCYINLPINDHRAKKKEMTTEQIKSILKEAEGLGCLQVHLTGGEPLLRSDFEEIYLFTRKLGMRVLLYTNATLINDRLVSIFSEYPPLDPIEVSVYGMNESSYESITRTKGSFSQFKNGVDLLVRKKIPFIVKGILLPSNKKEVEEFGLWSESLPFMRERAKFTLCLYMRCRGDNKKKNLLIDSLRLSPEEYVRFITKDSQIYRKEKQLFAKKFMKPPGNTLFGCGAGKSISIDAYGNIQPCMHVRVPGIIMNYFESESTAPLADSLKLFAKLNEFIAKNPEYIRRCANCFLKSLCNQCPGLSWDENGTLDTPIEYFCELAHAQARYMGWLKENEESWTVKNWQERVEGILE